MQSKIERKMCGTCEYWSGSREPAFDAHKKPKVNVHDMHAICNKQGHRFTNEIRWREQCCKNYDKWKELF